MRQRLPLFLFSTKNYGILLLGFLLTLHSYTTQAQSLQVIHYLLIMQPQTLAVPVIWV